MAAALPTRKRALKVALVAALILPAALLLCSSHREPVYQGKTLSSWFQEFDASVGASADARAALRSLGTNAVPWLVQGLTRRSAASESYTALASVLPRWAYHLLPDWHYQGWQRREHLAMALGELGTAARAAVPALVEALNQTEKEPFHRYPAPGMSIGVAYSSYANARAQAGLALWKIAPASPQVVAALVEVLKQNPSQFQNVIDAAADGLAHLGPQFKDQIPAVIASLKFQDATLYRGGIGTVVTSSRGSAKAIPELIQALQDPRPAVREAAAHDLQTVWPGHQQVAKAALPALIRLLHEAETSIRVRAAEAVFFLEPVELSNSVPAVIELLVEKDYRIRLRAVDLLRLAGKEATAAGPALKRLLNDPAPVVRVWATEALKAVEPAASVTEVTNSAR